MGAKTAIEWCDHTVNFWWGCTKVSPACEHCYAETLAKLFSHGRASWGPGGLRWIRTAAALSECMKLNRWAQKAKQPARVFINSMSDTFEDRPDLEEPREHLFYAIRHCPWLRFLLLTKRPENVLRMAPTAWRNDGFPSNVWMGTTVENQAMAEKRIPELLRIPACVRFLSCEPLLEAIQLQACCTACCPNRRSCWPEGRKRLVQDSESGGFIFECICSRLNGIHWVICGGESGQKARPIHPQWARDLRDQCAAADVPFFFKQWGEFVSVSEVAGPGRHHQFPNGATVRRTGKKRAGRLLDGQEHSAFPEVR